jgi:general secretion pathway protein F
VKFAVKAVDAAKGVVELELEAADEVTVRELARHRGYAVLTLSRSRLSTPWELGRPFPATLFSIELLALLDAGLNVVEALQTLAEKEPRGAHRRVLDGLLQALQRGESFSRAIERMPQHFSELYVATIRSSERTGNVREALSRFIAYQEELEKLRKKVVAALIYPAILLGVGTAVLAFLMFYVVPRFARVYQDISTGIPLFSSLLLSSGRWVEQHAVGTAVALVLACASLVYALSKEAVRAAFMTRLWRIGPLGERLRVYQLARLYRTVGMLLRAGVPAVRAFEMVSGLLAANLREQLARVVAALKEGRSISSALTTAGLATPVATRMMAVGEKSGQMGELMDRIARFYDDETGRFVDAFARVFEPALMALLGLAVGAVVVLMYMPIFELAGAIQ